MQVLKQTHPLLQRCPPANRVREHRNNRAHEEVVVVGAAALRGLPKRVMPRKLENAGKRGPEGEEKEWTDCVAEDRRLFGITGDWSTAALDPRVWCSTTRERGCRFMAAWVKEEEKASEHWKREREMEEADKVEVKPRVTVASLGRLRATLTLRVPSCRLYAFGCECEIVTIQGGYRMAGDWQYTELYLSITVRLSFSDICFVIMVFCFCYF